MRWFRALLQNNNDRGRTRADSSSPPPERRTVPSARIKEIDEARSAGRLVQALERANAALAEFPADAGLLRARGEVYFGWRRMREARSDLLAAHVGGASDSTSLLHLASATFASGDTEQAHGWLRKAVFADPANHEAHSNLAYVLNLLGKKAEAADAYRRALELRPLDCESLLGLAVTLLDEEPATSERLLRKALELTDQPAAVWAHLGMSHALQDRNDEALHAFERSAALERERGIHGDAFSNLAIHLGDEGYTTRALALFESGLARHAGVNAHLAYAHALLRAGRLDAGWQHYEFRWMVEPGVSRRRNFGVPMWNGQDLSGKTILLVIEQGLGDTFQFVRYAPLLKSLGAKVAMQPPGVLWDFAKAFPGIDVLAATEAQIPRLDYYIPLLSLPRVLGTTLESIPADIPYLHADPAKVAQWSSTVRGETNLTIGLVWAGNPAHKRDRYRSIPFDMLSPLVETPGVRFVSLQKGAPSKVATEAYESGAVLDVGSRIATWSDTAAVLQCLDLLIAVDTAAAHLAGAMGKPVWMLVPQPPDFRWLENRDDTPWYPTMRLFRQDNRRNWGPVIESVAAALVAVRDGNSNPKPIATSKRLPTLGPIEIDPQPGRLPAFAAVSETRYGILEYPTHVEPLASGLYWYGEHLQHQMDFLGNYIGAGDTVIEVAAGVGVHSLALSAAVGPDGQLLLYEGDPLLRDMLQQNIVANGIRNVTISRHRIGATSDDRDIDSIDALQLARLDWLKINTPPLASGVLRGASETLWRLRPRVFVSVDETSDYDPIGRELQAFGYRCWRLESPLFNPGNFNRRSNDIYDGRTALALIAIPEEAELASAAFPEMQLI